MIGYITLGTRDLAKAAAFYDTLFDTMNCKRIFDYPSFVAWGSADGGPFFSVTRPYDGNQATVGNGTMIALVMSNTAEVDAFHRLALSLGAQNEGDPGEREEGFYCAYFRDLDGNKVNAYTLGNA